jgi:hypothetical protein
MLNYTNYAYLRYVLLINVIAALVPAMRVGGRANDPLLRATWWNVDQHSAVLVVSLAAILASALVFLATRKGIRKWWVFVGCGVLAGDFPATFYLAMAPDHASLAVVDMYFRGTFCGLLAGAALSVLLRNRAPKAAA